ncbi:MAG: hypothetical protein Q4D05_07875 [Acinetobacter sp.]|nr:hypothetical protein [Acinetobacter sp.]
MEYDLETATDAELEKMAKILNITKMQLDIAKIQQEINQNHEINMATIEKMKAETEKIQKETKFYPMLTFTMGIVAVIGGTVAAVITKLL